MTPNALRRSPAAPAGPRGASIACRALIAHRFDMARRLLCALLAIAVLLAAAPAALAELGNPFDEPAAADAVGSPYGDDTAAEPDPSPAPTPTPKPNGADLFNLGPAVTSPAIGTSPNADPLLGWGTAAPDSGVFASAAPTSIPGYNPFDPDSYSAPAVSIMYVVSNVAAIRRAPENKARVLTTAPFGQQLSVTAIQDNWARVSAGSKNGYCRMEQLSSSNPCTLSKVMYVQPRRVALAHTPERKSGTYHWLNMGDTVTMVAISSDGLWARVTDGSTYGFVPSFALDESPAGQGTPMWCAVGTTKLMVNPDNWIQIGTLSLGQGVSLMGYMADNTIAKVRSSSGYVAYCAASALDSSNPLSMNTKVFAQVSGKILYRSASHSAHAGGIGKNARLTLLGVDKDQYWAVVKYGGKRYYTPFALLSGSRPGKGYRVLVTTRDDTPLYRNKTEIASSLPAGTRMYLTGVSGTAAKVATIPDNTVPASTGFVPLEYLKGE